MEFYKLAGIGDIGDIVVYLNTEPEYDKRGVIGLGEPPTVGGLAARVAPSVTRMCTRPCSTWGGTHAGGGWSTTIPRILF